jgi:hypothetical protein
MRLIDADALTRGLETYGEKKVYADVVLEIVKQTPTVDPPTGSWISRIDNDIWMLECSVCGCRVQEEKYRTAVGQNATKCPYCGAELGLGGYSYDEYANRPSQRGEDE